MSSSYTIHRHHHHFGWDNANPPALTVAPGDTVELETVDASGAQLSPSSTVADVTALDFAKVNPVTGPVVVDGAEPGDALKVTLQGFQPSGWGWTANIPGFGLLADQFTEPALHLWKYDPTTMAAAMYGPGGACRSSRSPARSALAPAEPGLHSIVPPRRVGGNMDIRDMAAGTTLYLPVEVPGALFSVGDTHAAQGDGEVCGTAIESPMTVTLSFDLVKGANLKFPRFTTAGTGQPPLRRARLRGDHRHRPRPVPGRARCGQRDDRPAQRPPRHERRSRPTCCARSAPTCASRRSSTSRTGWSRSTSRAWCWTDRSGHPAADGRASERQLQGREPRGAGGRRPLARDRGRPDRRSCRRVGLRQERDRAGRDAAPAGAARHDRRRPHPPRWRGPAGAGRAGDAPGARQPDRHDLPGADDLPQPDPADRLPDRRGAQAAPPGDPRRNPRPRPRPVAAGRDRRPRAAARAVSRTSSRAACASG